MCFGTESFCSVCGDLIIQTGKGRTREYCSNHCKDYFKYKNALEKCINNIHFFSSNNASLIKGDIFRMANLIVIKKKD